MAELLVELVDISGRAFRALVAGEVINPAHQDVVRQFTMMVGETKTLEELDPGRYVVVLSLPSGQTVSGNADVVEGPPGQLVVQTTPSSHEWLGWPTFTGEVASAPRYERERQLTPRPAPVPIWHRLWRQAGRSWTVEPWPQSHVDSDSVTWGYGFQSSRYALRAVQVGGMNASWRVTVLPPADHVDVTIRPSTSDASFERGVQVAVASNDKATEGLLRYLATGSLEQARLVGDELTRQSEEMLRDKIENPMAAAVGGYYLLQVRAWNRMHTWPANFVRFIDWLPDAAIVHGLWLLDHPEHHDQDGAVRAFVEATRRGVPVFTVGLRRLHEALRMLARGRDGPELREALQFIRPYADAADWTQPFTTFYGAHPSRPGIASTTGVPLEGKGIQFLPDGWQSLEFHGQFPPTQTFVAGSIARANLRVKPTPGGWVAEPLDGEDEPDRVLETRGQALEAAMELARSRGWARVIVYGADGSTEDVLGVDPGWEAVPPATGA